VRNEVPRPLRQPTRWLIFGITEVLLRAAIDGESTRFTRQDSIAETWRIL
jgi:hypothetical protein